ncbi:ATP-dependent DNA helicase PIF1-like [Parasteatoda tepidariorum]|uniref:ATP-dependent DNA helicase PIF1-like n=1 Tax=Parasteatoda tepidariorum TaxID=114398 RepID=UPI0039BC8F16
MIPRKAIEMIDRTFRDLLANEIPFGGKIIILGGDFRQVLPVVKKATHMQVINETIKYSFLWPFFEILHLTINMRVKAGNQEFANWLLTIGNGELLHLDASTPDLYCKDIISWFFEKIDCLNTNFINHIILSPQNDEVNKVNENILSRVPGEEVISYSIDKATLYGVDKSDGREEEATLRYSIEYLNSINLPGLPPHQLKLKVGCIVMLIRNISIVDGLCNGTRLTVLKIGKRVLTCQIATGNKNGSIVNLPRIELNTLSSNSSLPFVLYRRQFPVRLAYALTINKAQGQTFDKVGLYIERPIFSHGQLYVALSRCTTKENIKIFIKDDPVINNIVYREIL